MLWPVSGPEPDVVLGHREPNVRANSLRLVYRSVEDIAMELRMQLNVIVAVVSLGIVAAIVLGIV